MEFPRSSLVLSMKNYIYSGDNLDSLVKIPSNSIDLAYLDPPFSSGRRFNVILAENMAQELAYKDAWEWDGFTQEKYRQWVNTAKSSTRKEVRAIASYLEAFLDILTTSSYPGGRSLFSYLAMMAPRLIEVHRVLRLTGTLYLHCDPTASHYLKAMLDLTFGIQNFRSEIIWQRTSAHNNSNKPGPIHDTILMYTKSENFTWNVVYHKYNERYLEKTDGVDADGRKWKADKLMADGVTKEGDSGKPWRGVDPSASGQHWAIRKHSVEEYERRMKLPLEGSLHERLDKLDAAGLIHWPAKVGGKPRSKLYVNRDKGVPLQDIWYDIPPLSANSEEFVDFDTQKPIALLKRLILASSNEGGLVLDAFMGSGTAVMAAQELNRNWIGLELTAKIASVAVRRIIERFGEDCFEWIHDFPVDLESAQDLANKASNREPGAGHRFQCWACYKINAIPRGQGPDKGVDGEFVVSGFYDRVSRRGIISVKSCEAGTDVDSLRGFIRVMERQKADVGVFVLWERYLKKTLHEEATALGTYTSGVPGDTYHYPRLQFVTVEQLVDPNWSPASLKIPGFIPKPEQSKEYQEKSYKNEMYDIAMSLPSE